MMLGTPRGAGRLYRLQEVDVDTGIVRKIDDLGRIVIPAETRRLFNINDGDELAISVEDDTIVIRKLAATCVFCGSTEGVSTYKGRGVCTTCRGGITGA